MIAVARGAPHAAHGLAREGQPRLTSERAQRVQMVTRSEQLSAIVSGACWVPCNGKDRRKMPLWVRRMRRTGGQEGRPGLFAQQGLRSEKGRSRRSLLGQAPP